MAGEDDERETFVSIPRSLWFRWCQWCEFNGFEPRHKFVSVLRLWMSDVTDAELDAHLASTASAKKASGGDGAMSLIAAIETSLACDECGKNYANVICGQCSDQFCADCIDAHYDAEHRERGGGDGG